MALRPFAESIRDGKTLQWLSVPFRSVLDFGKRPWTESDVGISGKPSPRLHPHPPWLPRNRIVPRERILQFSCVSILGATLSAAPVSGPSIVLARLRADSPLGPQWISRCDKRDQNEQTRVMPFPSISPPTALVSLSELDRSASAFRHNGAPTEATPFSGPPRSRHAHPHPSQPAATSLHQDQGCHPISTSQGDTLSWSLVFWCSWLPLASQGAIRGKATAGAAFTMFPPFHRLFAPYQMSQQLTLAQLGRPPPSPHLARPRYLHPRTHIHGRPCHHHTTGRASNVLGLELAPDGLEPDSALPRCPKA